MSSSQFETYESGYTPYRASLTSFGSIADDKAVKRSPFTLQGTVGAGWVTFDADWYHLRPKSGFVQFRDTDDDGNDVDISSYQDYQDAGNQAFRVTYTVKNVTTQTTYTNESLTFAYADAELGESDNGASDGELAQNLWVKEIHAEFGDIAGWQIGTSSISSGSGNVVLDSSIPSLALGSSMSYASGTGIWMGLNSGAYKLRIGDSTNNQFLWNGTTLVAAGFTIGLDYIRDLADSFGLASTVSGSNDVRIWVGSTFASRTTAPLQIYEDGYIFAKDIVLAKGSLSGASGATGYGYAVDPLLLCHFDGAKPFETDFRGSAIGHKGQVDTRSGGVIFYEGLYNKCVAICEGTTTNLVTNPSFETSATAGWTTIGTWATNAQSTTQSRFGANSCKLVNSSGSDAFNYFVFTAAAATSTISIWLYRESGTATLNITLKENFGGFNVIATTTAATTLGGWQRIVVTGATTASSNYRLEISSATGNTFYIDGAQAESTAYVTPYFDGSFTATYNAVGYAWTGTAHASTSTRAAATLTYPASGNINLAQGSLSFWYYANPTLPTNAYAFAVRIGSDDNNYLRVNLATSAALKPQAMSASGGSAVNTSSGATAATANAWHHVAVTWTTGALKLYLDGVLSGATATYVVPVGTPSTIEIGSYALATQANTRLDDLAILPVVLTLNEIKSIYYSAAPLMLGVSNQELRLSGAGLGDVFGNANGLFARGADGTASFGLLNGTVNATTWGGASESFDAGDYMFGSNASGKSNQTFDASSGTFALRLATVKKISLDTSGTMLIGSDISAAATTSMAVFSGSVTYNSESMAAGNILLGDNSTDKINIKWTAAGGFVLRDGTTAVATMNQYGIVTDRALGHAQVSVSVTNGTIDFDDGLHAEMRYSYIRISSSTGAFTIAGITPAAVSGQRLIIHNNSANNMTFQNSGSPSSGYDTIATFGSPNSTTGDGIAELVYNDNSTRWDLISIKG